MKMLVTIMTVLLAVTLTCALAKASFCPQSLVYSVVTK